MTSVLCVKAVAVEEGVLVLGGLALGASVSTSPAVRLGVKVTTGSASSSCACAHTASCAASPPLLLPPASLSSNTSGTAVPLTAAAPPTPPASLLACTGVLALLVRLPTLGSAASTASTAALPMPGGGRVRLLAEARAAEEAVGRPAAAGDRPLSLHQLLGREKSTPCPPAPLPLAAAPAAPGSAAAGPGRM